MNPVFQYTLSKESNSDEKLFLNTRGVSIRGKISNKIGFYSYITDNQERDPSYVRQWVSDRRAVPGNGLYKNFKGTGYDYFDARGYITFNVGKYIDVVFGYDKNFIGNGHRSLMLSDFLPTIFSLNSIPGSGSSTTRTCSWNCKRPPRPRLHSLFQKNMPPCTIWILA